MVTGRFGPYALLSMHDPELQLAIAACRANFDGVEVAASGIDWDRFLTVAERHRVQALCWNGLEPLRERMPPPATDLLQRRASTTVEANLRIAAELARLLASFQSAGIALLFLKGLALGALAYREPFLKMGWDIDLLVGPDRLPDAARLLRSKDYVPVTPAADDDRQIEHWHRTRKESVWHRADGDFHIDLHTRLADHPGMLATVGIGSPSQIVSIAPGIELPTLATDELFAYLAVHGASSAWFRLKWITDFAALLHGQKAEEIRRLYDKSQRLGAGRAAAQALLLANRIYDTEIGQGLRQRLLADPANRWLTTTGERELAKLGEPTARFFGTASIHLTQLLLLPGWRFKFSEARRQLRSVMSRENG